MKQNGITLISLVVTIVVIIILAGVTINVVLFENGIINKAKEAQEEISEAKRSEDLEIAELLQKLGGDNVSYKTAPVGSVDFVQPWLFNDYSKKDFEEYILNEKRAGFDTIILSNVLDYEGGKQGSDIKIKNLWYESKLQNYMSSVEYNRPQVLDNLLEVIEKNNMKIYIGIGITNEWWTQFTDDTWRNNTSNFENEIIQEIYDKYGKLECFSGIYWPQEMYNNNLGYETLWAEMLNTNISKLNELEKSSGKKIPLIVSPFISPLYDMTKEEIEQQWIRLIDKSNFREGDIFALQDGLGTSKIPVNKIKDIVEYTGKAIKENGKVKMNFWINVENYVSDVFKPAECSRFITQLKISALYADKLVVFSYSHYYNPKLGEEAKKIDKEYRNYYKKVTGKEYYKIEVPNGGSVYEDRDGQEVPVPKGFEIVKGANRVKDGLVITDKYGNEFVWIPVNGGIKQKGYIYNENEYETVYYTRYMSNGININDVQNGVLPIGVSSEENQINKYKGFYVGRYESSFEYNEGAPRANIKKSNESKVSETFSWQYADHKMYTGYMLNNISYIDARNMAESMKSSYNYDNTVSTGLINGTQWDTMLKWFHSSDSTFSKISDGRTWGNYIDSIEPATNGNYESGKLKATGSNENWKMNNVYDIAGNLAEWTDEIKGSESVIRSNAYNANGIYGTPSYGMLSGSYQFPHVGFRVVLYIE